MLATFPFGWVKDINSENWQLLWDSINHRFYAKGAVSKKIIDLKNIEDCVITSYSIHYTKLYENIV